MLTTQFEELRMSEDESFDSFYSKLNEVVIGIAGKLPCQGDNDWRE